MVTFDFAMHGRAIEALEPSLAQIQEYYPNMTWEVVKRGMANRLSVTAEKLDYEKSQDFLNDPRWGDWHDAGVNLNDFPVTLRRPRPKSGEGEYNSYMGSRSLFTGEKE